MSDKPPKDLQAFLDQLRPLWPVLRGSLAQVELTCGTPSCRCHHGGPKHTGWYFSYRVRGKSHTVYVPQSVLEEVQRGHAHWLELKDMLEQQTHRTLESLRQRARQERKRSRRPPSPKRKE